MSLSRCMIDQMVDVEKTAETSVGTTSNGHMKTLSEIMVKT